MNTTAQTHVRIAQLKKLIPEYRKHECFYDDEHEDGCPVCNDLVGFESELTYLERKAPLEVELDEARAEVAACLRFLASELHWEDFRAEMLYFDDEPKQRSSDENARKLKNYLAAKGHGIAFLQEHAELLRLNARLLEALEAIQWGNGWIDQDPESGAFGVVYHLCPACDQTEARGHSPDCRVGGAIEAAKERT